MPKPRVLILCTGNSCRSQMGEGWVRHDLGDRVEVHSAGTRLSFVHPLAIRVMGEAGVDISSHRSKSVEEMKDLAFDLVVTVCDSAREACPILPGARKTLHQAFEDPALAGDGEDALSVFRRVRDEIRARLVPLVAAELN
jgi:arsenate reductase